MKKIILILIPIVSLLTFSSYDGNASSQSFKFTYKVTIKNIPEDAKEIKFWIPFPSEDKYQTIVRADIRVPGQYEISEDNKYGNKILYSAYKNEGNSFIVGTLTYEITRKERLDKPTGYHNQKKSPLTSDFDKYLKPSKLVTLSARVKKLAREITRGKTDPLDKAKSIYDYVFENMEYNKEVPGWGYGDTERACDLRKGNCTDFHSLFISLARASGIPAKFVIGFNIPDKKESTVKGYHCWAEFYVKGSGWVPVDISQAWKDKSKKEYYFGSLDQNRIQFSTGRDITLTPSQKGTPLNYFIYPYLEIDGNMAFGIETSFEHEKL